MAIQSPRTDSIFWGALAIKSADQRAAYLDQACGTDQEFRAEVEALLIAHPKAEQFLESPPANLVVTTDQPSSEGPGAVIGPYKVLEQIGEGGFGVVFMAEQTEPVRRKVALKVIKPGMDTRQVIARFEVERQALAIMDHPNIAKVLDAGATASGRPYFVMELVRGIPITEYCDQRQLAPRERLELFFSVCQAVQHAHSKGIIHRDIKPSNVLVTQHDDKPVIKVIDFGIAKATTGQLTDKTLFTGIAQMIGTPLYMSPEQAGLSGLDIDTRSDVYSLGVLLYELLTGTTPFDKARLRQAAYDEVRRIIREEDPPKPSTRLSELSNSGPHAPLAESGTRSVPATAPSSLASVAALRHTEPAKLTRLVKGDLDWIVMKALEKDRSRRYETANGFAADVLRYLADEPVTACPPSAAYRFRKFARRNKAALGLAGLVLCFVLLLGSGIGWNLRARAERQARVSAKVGLILEEVQRLERQQKWPAALSAAEQAEAALAGGEGGPATRARIRQELADLEMVARLDAVRLKRVELHDRKFDDAGAAAGYAQAFREYGVDLETLPRDEAVSRLKKHARIAIPLAAAIDDFSLARGRAFGKTDAGRLSLLAISRGLDPDPTRDRLRASFGRRVTPQLQAELRALAESIDVAGQPPATLELFADTLNEAGLRDSQQGLLRRTQRRYPDDFWINFALADSLWRSKDYQGSVEFYRITVALRPSSSTVHTNLGGLLQLQKKLDEAEACDRRALELDSRDANAHTTLGVVLQDQRKLDEAEACHRRALELDPQYALAHENLGEVLRRQTRLDEAEASCRRAVEIDPNLAQAWLHLGAVLDDLQKPDEAETCYRRGLKLDPSNAGGQNNLGVLLHKRRMLLEAEACFRHAIRLDPADASAHSNLGAVLLQRDQLNEAEVYLRRAIELDPNYATAHNNLGAVLRLRNQLDQAEASLRRAIELDPQLVLAHINLGKLLYQQQKLDEAVACYRRAIELDPSQAQAHSNLGAFLRQQNQLDEAEACLRRAVELDPNLAQAYCNLGALLGQQNRLDEAVAYLRRAIELDPNDAMVHNNLGELLRRQNQLDQAEASLRRAIELDPQLARAHRNLGRLLYDQQKLEEAVACYRRAIELDPNSAAAYGGLGSGLWKQQAFAEALVTCAKRIELEPQNAIAHNGFAWYLVTCPREDLRDAPRAIELAARAIELAPQAKGFRNTLGVAHYRAGHWMVAIEELNRSFEELGGNAADGFFLAMAHWQLDQKDEARAWHGKAVEWMANTKDNEELTRFRAEAEDLLGIERKKD